MQHVYYHVTGLLKYSWIIGLYVFGVFLQDVDAASPQLYYVNYETTTMNGILIYSHLSMIPITEEYRAVDFKKYTTDGVSTSSSTMKPEISAVHNAIANLLIEQGLKSVKSKKSIVQQVINDQIQMSYQGVIQFPYDILHQKIDNEKETVNVSIMVWFSPIAFPDQWQKLFYRQKIKEHVKNVLDLFK
ncbi:MAG: hypothetical protein HQK77_12355 [Desulfobacterales bacterium]|nr:hypothetical protein [Desulfobacterales bacterium]